MAVISNLLKDVDNILKRDPAANTRFEVITCYPGLHAIWIHRISHYLFNGGWLWVARFLSALSRWLTGIEIHPGAKIGHYVFIDHGMGVVIGETAEVGDGCTIYQGVTLGGTSLYKGVKRHPTLGKNVTVGAGAKILGGFTVGDGARIGSNSVVVKPIPAGKTAVGIPARLIDTHHTDSSIIDGKLDITQEDTRIKHTVFPTYDKKISSHNTNNIFNPYGILSIDDDPIQMHLEQLRQQIAAQQVQIDALLKQQSLTQ